MEIKYKWYFLESKLLTSALFPADKVSEAMICPLLPQKSLYNLQLQTQWFMESAVSPHLNTLSGENSRNKGIVSSDGDYCLQTPFLIWV